jgi:D-glycero-alpha-D-manno-heptose 1-phosphate guanylyltransferase
LAIDSIKGLSVTAVLLVGGLGTRLRPVLSDSPKALARVGKDSFLALLVQQLRQQGVRHIVMCTGYLGNSIETEFGNGAKWDVAIQYSRESSPLGTAGALKHARSLLDSVPEFLVANGDSFLELDIAHLLDFHHQHDGIATIAAARVPNASRYGTIVLDKSSRVTAFVEKTQSEAASLINGGVYVFKSSIFGYIPDGPSSLERDVFPRILDRRIYALQHSGLFIDIGTPEDYQQAQRICERLSKAAMPVKEHQP